MNKKIRYSLIGIGFVVFAVLAPVVILYVRGIAFDFSKKSFVQTGILTVRTEPKDAQIFLNGRLKLQGQGDIKFLLPGEYQVTIKKAGYFDWSKRLTVAPGQVTRASGDSNNISLFFSAPQTHNIAAEVLDVYSQKNQLLYLTKNRLFLAAANNPAGGQNYSLPKTVDEILAHDDSGQNFLLGTSAAASPPAILLFNANSGQFTDVSGQLLGAQNFQFGGNGELYALASSTLYSINPQAKTKTLLFYGVKAYYWQGGSLYFLKGQGENYSLLASQAPYSDSQTLVAGLPEFAKAKLLITFEKKVFLLGDGNLYIAGSQLETLAQNVSSFYINPETSQLLVISSGELDYYQQPDYNSSFITRSSDALSSPVINTGLGWAWFLKNDELTAVELDTRDNQNQYWLYKGKSPQKIFVDADGKNVLILDGGELKSLTIR